MKTRKYYLVMAVLFLSSCQSMQGRPTGGRQAATAKKQEPAYTRHLPSAEEIVGSYELKEVFMPAAGTDLSDELKRLPARPTITINPDGHAKLNQFPYFSPGAAGSYRFEGFLDFDVTWKPVQVGNVVGADGGPEAYFGLRLEGLPWRLSSPAFTGERADGLIFVSPESTAGDAIIFTKKN